MNIHILEYSFEFFKQSIVLLVCKKFSGHG
jgi:hypothetical protein